MNREEYLAEIHLTNRMFRILQGWSTNSGERILKYDDSGLSDAGCGSGYSIVQEFAEHFAYESGEDRYLINTRYYKNGHRHRLDGPAFIHYWRRDQFLDVVADVTKQYFVGGAEFTKNEFDFFITGMIGAEQ